jgi:hypothetical protein
MEKGKNPMKSTLGKMMMGILLDLLLKSSST